MTPVPLISLFHRLFALTLVCSLAGCESELNDYSTMSIAMPRSIDSDNRLLNDYAGAGVEVIINNGVPKIHPAQQTDTWSIDVQGINIGTQNTARLRWFLVVGNESYDIATQTDTFFADSVQRSHTVNVDYVTDLYDHDNDSVSNYLELAAGGFPYPEELEPEMLAVDVAGCFSIGSPPMEYAQFNGIYEAQTEICNLMDYSIGRYEITYEQYRHFALATDRELPSQYDWQGQNLPVTGVLWSDARDYTIWLSTITGLNYSLPTEAQWEYAARAGTTSTYHTGQTIDTTRANFRNPTSSDTVIAVYFQASLDADYHGAFRLIRDNLWEETAIDNATKIETSRFVFEEVGRENNDILLYDASRDYLVRLALDARVIQISMNGAPEQKLYDIVDGPSEYTDVIGEQPLPVGSFPANGFGLHDVHGNVSEWTCSELVTLYEGSEFECVDNSADEGLNFILVKRGGSWGNSLSEIRSAARAWNNLPKLSDRFTGFRLALNP